MYLLQVPVTVHNFYFHCYQPVDDTWTLIRGRLRGLHAQTEYKSNNLQGSQMVLKEYQ